jgi:hypothetical protein
MKKIYCVWADWFGEMQFFFDDGGNLLQYWCCSDALYRGEYMNGLMKALGFEVLKAEQTDPRFESKIKETLLDLGASEEDFQ